MRVTMWKENKGRKVLMTLVIGLQGIVQPRGKYWTHYFICQFNTYWAKYPFSSKAAIIKLKQTNHKRMISMMLNRGVLNNTGMPNAVPDAGVCSTPCTTCLIARKVLRVRPIMIFYYSACIAQTRESHEVTNKNGASRVKTCHHIRRLVRIIVGRIWLLVRGKFM